jgi:hypothetical protein
MVKHIEDAPPNVFFVGWVQLLPVLRPNVEY